MHAEPHSQIIHALLLTKKTSTLPRLLIESLIPPRNIISEPLMLPLSIADLLVKIRMKGLKAAHGRLNDLEEMMDQQEHTNQLG
jgi:hypothetical protein